jgi:hypothetical protein
MKFVLPRSGAVAKRDQLMLRKYLLPDNTLARSLALHPTLVSSGTYLSDQLVRIIFIVLAFALAFALAFVIFFDVFYTFCILV